VAAAALATRLKRELVIVHTIDAAEQARQEAAQAELASVRERLARWPVKVSTAVLSGIADEALVAHAAKIRAGMIVIGALGRRSKRKWSLGGTADRTAQEAKSPVLVVRASEPFEQWANANRPLSILIAVDATSPSDAAVRWLAEFATHGPITIVAAHVYWPPEHLERAGTKSSTKAAAPASTKSALPIGQGHAEIERDLARELGARYAPIFGSVPFEIRLVGGLGRPADHLVQIAEKERADLIVVGNHQRIGLDRFWHGSVSHGVVDRASSSVMCVPSA
jgi:nucleotide-binding universal stress UspA family protein